MDQIKLGSFDEWTAIVQQQDEMYKVQRVIKELERKKQQELMK